MASQVEIANLGLLYLGASPPIVSMTQDVKTAIEMNRAWAPTLAAATRNHKWNFAKERKVIAPLSATPAFEFTYQFQLPPDCLRVLPPNKDVDWEIEGGKLLTNDGDSINLHYIKLVTDTTKFDASFVPVLAAELALACVESLAQSQRIEDRIKTKLDRHLKDAKRVNAFEGPARGQPTDPWILARY